MTKEKLLEIEPKLSGVLNKAKRFRTCDMNRKFWEYETAKDEARKLRTFTTEEWDCFIASLLDVLDV